MREFLRIAVAAAVIAAALYFAYRLSWFALVGRRAKPRREVVATSAAYAAVIAAVGLWFLPAIGAEVSSAVHRWLFYSSLGFCVTAIILSRFGERRSAPAIVVFALIVALNWIGTVFQR